MPFTKALFYAVPALALQANTPESELKLDAAGASHFAKLALKCVRQEYPNKLDHVMNGAEEVRSPKALHPAFYGCFDWHSSVHGHWMLVKLLRDFPELPEAKEIRAVLDENLAPDRIALEVAYFVQPNRKSFERTYGWAWLLKLAAELRAWDSPDARRWSANLQPLADRVAAALMEFLPKQTYPIRTGVHPNTAFSLSLSLDYARVARDSRLEALLIERARAYYGKDRNGPISWEPGGEDFLSPCLEESALMAKVLPKLEFRLWVVVFLPKLLKDGVLAPAVVSDRTDPKIVHLDGLNLSRARCLYAISGALGPRYPRRKALLQTADAHARHSLPFISSGSYEGEHWLGSFAVQMLEARSGPSKNIE
ncbi:MAG: DUF2891 domain-containing protein [Holophagaceae bacterium]|nr:DUF2891 domain-containing protein [Holophagaceae bacterium]